MEAYILDPLFRRSLVVDAFESLIWAERWAACGDFELSVPATPANRELFSYGSWLATNNSHRVMRIETRENKSDSDGRKMLTLKGRSLESILYDRVAKATMGNLTDDPYWSITDKPADIIRYVFDQICRVGVLDLSDRIPLLYPGTMFPDSNIPEPEDVITAQIQPKPLYDVIKELCDMYKLGFRLTRDFDTSKLYFDVYSGTDRTTQQTVFPAVIFSPDLDNLQNTTELTTIADYKNVAYVFTPVGSAVVYALGVDPEVEGFDKRVLVVSAEDITTTDTSLAEDLMTQRGREELAKARQFSAFDGEISQNSSYTYGVDYNLGDLVEMRAVDGATNLMRVTEQIFVSDAEGDRTYPTLQIDNFITPGSWLSWDYNQVWQDLGTTEYWSNQP